MLHIHDGDSTAETAKKANIPGEHLAWREALVYGPSPSGLSDEQFMDLRASHLAHAYGVKTEQCKAELRAQHDAINNFSDHEEVVLWFEHDLFCQVNLIYLLGKFAQRELGATRLSLVCIGDFPGVEHFRGLGQLNEEQLASLFPARTEITKAQLELGSKAWAAYSAADAVKLLALLDADTSALPFLEPALVKHLQRFPSTTNGLSRIGNVGLELIDQGYRKFKSLFPAFGRREPVYGFGDAQLYLELKRLADVRTPVLTLSSFGNPAPMNAAQILLSSFEITEHGRAVLSGDEDFIRSNGIDLWLGGVHLKGKEAQWRWDEQGQELLVSL